MTTRFLMAAEADKIQDFIFRSARLQEVMGGSMLLNRFCEQGVAALAGRYGQKGRDWSAVVNDGGSFRLWFASSAQALEFGQELAELYRQVVDGSLTVSPVCEGYEVDESGSGRANDGFAQANEIVSKALQRAKTAARPPVSVFHLPAAAFCASCGVSLADRHVQIFETEMYLCPACQAKGREYRQKHRQPEAPGLEPDEFFINRFRSAVRVAHEKLALSSLELPEEPADAFGRYDPRSHVAYLLADGNSMGELFRQCQTDVQLNRLSFSLGEALRAALAEPVFKLHERLVEQRPDEAETANLLPVMPLILGGDDVFALLPAPYALEFACRFARVYEEQMAKVLQTARLENAQAPTLGLAVVICKSNYPYRLAHARGEELLQTAKRLAKAGGARNRSALAVERVIGSPLEGGHAGEQTFAAGMRPFWTAGRPDGHSLPYSALLEARRLLDALPAGRRKQLADLYLPENLPHNVSDLPGWNVRLQTLLERIGRHPAHRRSLEMALKILGAATPAESQAGETPVPDLDLGRWKYCQRAAGRFYWANALPDLLDLWDFVHDLDLEPEVSP